MYRLSLIAAFIILGIALPHFVQAQVELTLEEVVSISRCENLSARKAYVEKKNAYWNYQIHKSNLRPQLSFDTQLTDFSKGVTQVSQNDGSIAIKTINQNSTSGNLSLAQPLPFLGADIFMNSYLFRFDNFSADDHSYSAQPIEVGIQMPVLTFNQLKWDQRIKPVEYLESKKTYDRNLEMSAYIAVEMFFQNVSDRNDWSMADANMQQNTELYRISQERFKTGQISQDELLQVQLMMVNARKDLKAAQVSMENSGLMLLTHLSLTDITDFDPVITISIPEFQITSAKAIEYALEYNPENIAFKRRLLLADEEVARARGTTGVTGNVFATVGYGSNFNDLPQWNQDLNQHATLQVGFSVPIIDWGRTHAARKQASMKKELEETSVLQERINFEKEIISLVNIVEMLKENISIVEEAESIASQRYEIAYNRYLAGDLSVLELNMAQNEKDYASRDLLSTVGSFWINYHRLRMITLYDFINQQALVTQNEN
ncbi:MAG: TolC family protein [Bacteroidales bacterium]|jgi:outer membrane protein TolC